MRAISALGLLSLELARFTQSTHVSSFCSFPNQSLRWKGNFLWLGSCYYQLWHYVVGNQCSPSGVLCAAGTVSQTARFLKSLGLAVPSPAPLGPDTCLGLDTPRLGVTERPGGAILASIPGPVLFLILPGALASVAAVPSIWGGRPAFMAAGEQCKGREGVRARRSPALPDPRDTGLGGLSHPACPMPGSQLHALLQAPMGLIPWEDTVLQW